VISTPKIFTAYARLTGKSGKLKAGEYEFPAGLNIHDILKKIVKGEVMEYKLKIIEGWSIADIVRYLEGYSLIEEPAFAREFERLAEDKEFATTLGFEGATSLEGYLFPDTYQVLKLKNPRDLIERLVARFKEVYTPELAALARQKGLTRRQLMTLASIVEKETGEAQERPLIAAVFLNRLKKKIPLQSDPTTIYGLENFDGNLRKEDLSNPHPYNTYVHPGLPPGPICNPGLASIEAVLYPAEVDYLYFVSKNDGSHEFSRTLAEHNRAVARYQLNKEVDEPKGIPVPEVTPVE
jgi:UPF0755 protein